MTMNDGSPAMYYAREMGTNRELPVIRVNYTSTPPVRWCPFCDASQQVGAKPSCGKCNAMWVDADMVNVTARVSAASQALGGRAVDVPAAPEPPPVPEVPNLEDKGISLWTLEELADGAEKARADGDIDLVLSIADEVEERQAKMVGDVTSAPSSPVEDEDADEDEQDEPGPAGDWIDKNCGFCGAIAGQKCTTSDGSTEATHPHAIRLK